MGKKIEIDEDQLQHVVDTAYAAYALSQLAFISLVQSGTISHDVAEKLLRQAMAANEKAGGMARRASPRLQRVLDLLAEDRKHHAALATMQRRPSHPS